MGRDDESRLLAADWKSAVSALPNKWREQAEEADLGDAIGVTHHWKLKDCADELEAALAARQPGAQEPVAVVGPDFTIRWIGSGPIAPLVQRHDLKRGSLLYSAPPAQGKPLKGENP